MMNLNTISYRRLFYAFSLALIGASIAALALWGLRLGIDFTGGSLVEVTFSTERPPASEVSEILTPSFGEVLATPVGDEGMVLRLRQLDEPAHQELLQTLRNTFAEGNAEAIVEERFTAIGPTIGAELRQNAIYAVLTVLVAIVLYVAWAFRRTSKPVSSFQYGIAAIAALFHDVIVTLGIFAALGQFRGVEIGTLFITALLTVLGFSVHDTIVIFDRVRENLSRRSERFPALVQSSVNESIVRSINTSFTTLLVLLFIVVFGGETLRWFAVALAVGIVFGTYSSLFVAAPLLVSWFRYREKRTPEE